METDEQAVEISAGKGSRWKTVLGATLGAGLLAWVFHDIHLERLAAVIGAMNWNWVLLAVVCDVAGYYCDGVRWHYLLRPSGWLSPFRATQAVYAGLFASGVLPMRTGELVRIYLAGRWMGLPLASVVPSMLVSRLLDGLWLVVGIAVTAILVPLPRDLVIAGDVLGVVVLAIAVALVCLVAARPPFITRWARLPAHGRGPAVSLVSFLGRVAAGVQDIGRASLMLISAAWSLVFLLLQAAAFWMVMVACHVPVSVAAGLAVFLIVHLGTTIPSAPANVGAYQFFTVIGLGLFGVDKTLAAGFSVVVFVILSAPLWVLGLAALASTGLTLKAIRADLNRIRRQDGEV